MHTLALCRSRWSALAADFSVRLQPYTAELYDKQPLTESELLAAGFGRHASVLSAGTQTGELLRHRQDQTDPLQVSYQRLALTLRCMWVSVDCNARTDHVASMYVLCT